MIKTKRAYEKMSADDGFRVLVDRLWPRGIRKEKLRLDAWFKELAPSTELRKEFGHNSTLWSYFQTQYKKELCSSEAKKKLVELARIAKKKNLTLVYGAKDERHNNAVVLKHVLEKL